MKNEITFEPDGDHEGGFRVEVDGEEVGRIQPSGWSFALDAGLLAERPELEALLSEKAAGQINSNEIFAHYSDLARILRGLLEESGEASAGPQPLQP